jgi:hypothetical protein
VTVYVEDPILELQVQSEMRDRRNFNLELCDEMVFGDDAKRNALRVYYIKAQKDNYTKHVSAFSEYAKLSSSHCLLLVSLNTPPTATSSLLPKHFQTIIRPSYEVCRGQSLPASKFCFSTLVSKYYNSAGGRLDSVKTSAWEEIARKGALGRIRIDSLAREIGFWLGWVPKYGA